MRVLVNALIMATELIAVATVAWLGYSFPMQFALGTAILALILGLMLEHARLRHELPFYFGKGAGAAAGVLVPVVAGVNALIRAAVAGIITLLTFSGTDHGRLFWIAIVFGTVLYLATNLLRLLAVRLEAHPSRWGYFRLAAPLGLAFSVGIAGLNTFGAVATPNLTGIGRTILFDTPTHPTVEQASELLFQLKLYVDNVIVTLLRQVVGADWAPVIGVLLSVNVLAGFVIALYAVVIAEMVVRSENTLL